MNRTDFIRQARALMNQHGLHHVPLQLDRSRRRLGCCQVTSDRRTKRVLKVHHLSFSQHYVTLLGWDELENVVLHEIAHALSPIKGHGPEWRAKARAVGAKPTRCVAPSAKPTAAVAAKCPTCGKDAGTQHRLPLRLYGCPPCKRAYPGQPDKYLLHWFKSGRYVPPCEMPARYQSNLRWILMQSLLSQGA